MGYSIFIRPTEIPPYGFIFKLCETHLYYLVRVTLNNIVPSPWVSIVFIYILLMFHSFGSLVIINTFRMLSPYIINIFSLHYWSFLCYKNNSCIQPYVFCLIMHFALIFHYISFAFDTFLIILFYLFYCVIFALHLMDIYNVVINLRSTPTIVTLIFLVIIWLPHAY